MKTESCGLILVLFAACSGNGSTQTDAAVDGVVADTQTTIGADGATTATDAATTASDTQSTPIDAVAGSCGSPQVRVTEIDVGATVLNTEDDDASLKLLSLSPIPAGGTRVAWLSNDKFVHVTTLNADDTINTNVAQTKIATDNDYSDIFADNNGGTLLVTRNAKGGGTLNCGTLTNLCGATGTLPSTDACYDMYMVRFDGTTETWATQLTQSSAAHPPYLNSPTDANNVIYIWWYAHHGRIAFDGTNYAGYFGAAISVSQTCGTGSANATGVNIHQGDEMKVVSPAGALVTGHDSFDWGCSHSGYERIVWDSAAGHFRMVCKNDGPVNATWNGRIADPNGNWTTNYIYPIDLWYADIGNLTVATGGGYWLTTSNTRAGQTPASNGLADVHLLHYTTATTTGNPDKDITLASDTGLNDRAPHLSTYGTSNVLAAWETSTATGDILFADAGRKLYVQVLDASTGAAVSAPILVSGVKGNRYQEFRNFPDGSVAYPATGSANTKIKIVRVMPCN